MSRPMQDLRGVGVVNCTPYTRDDRLNEAELRRHCRWLLENGITFMVPGAASGQFGQTPEAEFWRVLEIVVEEAGNRVPVIAYTGRPGTKDTIAATKRAQAIGAKAALLMQPYFTRPDAEGIYLHYTAVAEAVDLPLFFYNNPDRGGVQLPLDVVGRLVDEHENFFAIKQSDLTQLADTFLRLRGKTLIMPKAEKELLFGLTLGACGAMCFAANVIPRHLVRLYEAFVGGDLKGARETYFEVLPLINAIHWEPVPAVMKHMLNRMGWDFGGLRLPIHEVTPAHARAVDEILRTLALI